MSFENGTGSGDGSIQKKYWFRPKSYGYGLTPLSWEGWLLTLAFVGVILLFGKWIGLFDVEPLRGTYVEGKFLLGVLAFTFLFIRWASSHCDGELKWRWGLKK